MVILAVLVMAPVWLAVVFLIQIVPLNNVAMTQLPVLLVEPVIRLKFVLQMASVLVLLALAAALVLFVRREQFVLVPPPLILAFAIQAVPVKLAVPMTVVVASVR